MRKALFSLLLLSAIKAHALAIDTTKAEITLNKGTLVLKHARSGTQNYTFNMRWNAKTNAWETQSYKIESGYGWFSEPRLPHSFNAAEILVQGNKLHILNSKSISTYNTPDKTWVGDEQLNIADNPYHPIRAALVGNTIYIFKLAISGFFTDKITPEVWKYDLTERIVTRLDIPLLPDLSGTSQAVVYDDKVYFFGGYIEKGGALTNQQTSVWVFDPKTLAFTKKADMPESHFGAAATVLNDKIYVFGGKYFLYNTFQGGTRNYGISIYNPKTNAWEAWDNYREQLSEQFLYSSWDGWAHAKPIKDKIIAITYAGEMCIFNPASKKVTYQTTMPRLHGERIGAAVLGDRFYIAGGSDEPRRFDSFKARLSVIP